MDTSSDAIRDPDKVVIKKRGGDGEMGDGEMGDGEMRRWGEGERREGKIFYNLHFAVFSRTGKMPVPQRMNFLVKRAGEPVPKQVIENDARCEL
jgi:hypothetical protein